MSLQNIDGQTMNNRQRAPYPSRKWHIRNSGINSNVIRFAQNSPVTKRARLPVDHASVISVTS